MIAQQTDDVIETVTIDAKPAVSAETAKSITRAMKVLADVARIYKKYGTLARWHPIEPTHSEPKRAARLREATVPTGQYACSRCGLPFVAKTSERCQCKVVVKKRRAN